MLAWFGKHINNEPLSAIDRGTINLLRELLKKDGSSAANVDRYFAPLRAILRKCRDEWDYLETVPKVPMFNARPAEARWLSHAEFDQLVSELPPHLSLAARFAVLTGLRMRSMLALTWDRVHMTKRRAWIPPSQMKSGHAFGFPLSSKAVTVLRESRMLNPRGEHVFQYGGKSIDDCNTAAFAKAVKRAGLGSLRWHDLRHTFASWAVAQDVHLPELMQLGDWRSYSMVLKYAHFAPDHLAHAAEKIGTKAAHGQRRSREKRM